MSMDVLTILDRYRSTPWVDGGRDVDRDGGLDCWGLARKIVIDILGVVLPEDNSEAMARMGELTLVIGADAIRAGDLVLMQRGAHVGVCVGDLVIHSSRNAGVQTPSTAALQRLKLIHKAMRPRRRS